MREELPVSEFDLWTFKRDTNGRWIWVRQNRDGVALAASHANYGEVEECLADARLRGYKGG